MSDTSETVVARHLDADQPSQIEGASAIDPKIAERVAHFSTIFWDSADRAAKIARRGPVETMLVMGLLMFAAAIGLKFIPRVQLVPVEFVSLLVVSLALFCTALFARLYQYKLGLEVEKQVELE